MSTQQWEGLQCMTADEGPYQLDKETQKVLCFTSEGNLYISESHKQSAHILAFIDKLRREHVKFKLHLVSLEFITALYSRWNPAHKTRDSSFCQRMVADIIKLAVQAFASDVHILVREMVTQVKFRVHGELRLSSELSREDGYHLCSTLYQTMCDVAEPVFNPHRSQDGRLMSDIIPDCALYGGRIATRPTDHGLLMVIRLLYDRGSSQLELEQLGYLTHQVATINHMASRRFGINILSGPTGSGKSTTLECVLKRLLIWREQKVHVLTVEDPPEYRIHGAVQTPIVCNKESDDAISREWARAISNAMRLDPDILMCGEIRDVYSAIATFRAAMTGHGVWTTLHANDALATLGRLQDLGISNSLLGDSSLLTGLINQVLVRRLCTACKEPYREHQQQFSVELQQRIARFCHPKQLFVRGAGCEQCGGRGISGRTVVAEVIETNSELMQCFVTHGKEAARRYWLTQLQGVSKNHHLLTLINQGVVDPRHGEQDCCILDQDETIGSQQGEVQRLQVPLSTTSAMIAAPFATLAQIDKEEVCAAEGGRLMDPPVSSLE